MTLPLQENYRIRKDAGSEGDVINRYRFQTRDDILLPREPSPRKEFLEHSSLYGHQYMQGGAGEGTQRLKPDGSVSNIQVIKSDSVLPAYCNPPNPCPIGYTGESLDMLHLFALLTRHVSQLRMAAWMSLQTRPDLARTTRPHRSACATLNICSAVPAVATRTSWKHWLARSKMRDSWIAPSTRSWRTCKRTTSNTR